MPKIPSIIGKILYGGVFIAAVPVLLVFWARATEKCVTLPPIESLPAGVMIGVLGAAIMLAGMWAIYFYGHGLPMNAYPPSRFVTEGVFRLFPHPIYTGFSLLCFGIAVAAGSSSGFWLVSPAIVLGCVALVQGYEKRTTSEHFGTADTRHLIRLPPDELTPPTIAGRISAYLLCILPWLLFVQVTSLMAPTLVSVFPLAQGLPMRVFSAAGPIYLSKYLLILLSPFAAQTKQSLRAFVICGLAVTGLSGLLFIAFPNSITGLDHAFFPAASKIAFTLVAASTLAKHKGFWRIAVVSWTSLAVIGGLLARTQTAFSVIAGIAIFLIADNIGGLWEVSRSAAESIANSWTEWRFGSVRLINHGFYAAAGAFISLTIVGTLGGAAYVPHIIMITFLGILISSLSAQWIEGSLTLLRPYGWYGGVAGTLLGLLTVYAMGFNVWLLTAAFCVGAPWIQAAGRLRCLVQGCCHGRETTPKIGIRYFHPMSRVCQLSKLSGVAVHPTQLYSILCNIVIAVLVTRLWLSEASLVLIVGIYFILGGLCRFVEESFRGEPQTPTFAGLRLYQILAMLSVVGGIAVSMIGDVGNAPELRFNWQAIAASGCFAVFVLVAFGVDIPGSNKRFSRLA